MDSPTNRDGAEDLIGSHAEGVSFRSDGTKTFIPLENNPIVFEHLIHELGMSSELGFYDVYSLDDPDLLAMVPRPVHAIIFITAADTYHKVHSHDERGDVAYDGHGDEEPVFWAKQTIGHACGTMALLHSVANGSAKQHITPRSDLDLLLQECLPLRPRARATALYNSTALERAHMSAAVKGQSTAPVSQDPVGYHFISLVKSEKDGHMYEMDGGWNGPIDRGLLSPEDDLLSEAALEKGVKRFLKQTDGVLEFSIVALATKNE